MKQLFQSPILIRDPEEANQKQNYYHTWKVELVIQLQRLVPYFNYSASILVIQKISLKFKD